MLFFNLTMCQREGNFGFDLSYQICFLATHCVPLVHTVHQEANEASQIRRVRRWEWLHMK